MSLVELLRTKSGEYELLATWHAERAPLDDELFVACQAMAVVGNAQGGRRSDRAGVGRASG
jgi:hypothetical protein